MDFIMSFIDFVLHMDKYIPVWVEQYHTWTYLIIFAIVFCETGLVVTPFLPGDSLLFAAGTVTAAFTGGEPPLNILILVLIVFIAAFLGDNTNYFIGKFLGETVYQRNYKLIKREYLMKTHEFYERHGGKTLIIARFMPIIRTFAPFVAGVGKMTYPRFLFFSFIGNMMWVNTFCWVGHFFGNLQFVKSHFSIIIIAIIIVSVMPPVIGVLRHKFAKKTEN